MIAGPFVKIQEQDQGNAFLVTWSRGEQHCHRAFGSLEHAKIFSEAFIGKPLELVTAGVWWATV